MTRIKGISIERQSNPRSNLNIIVKNKNNVCGMF